MAYIVKHKVGEGSFARVFLLCSTADDNQYALKVIDKDRFSCEDGDKCVQEAKLMRKLRQENVCACFDAFEFESHLLLVTEFCPAGDMYGYLGNCRDAKPPQIVSEKRIMDWVLQIAKAIQYLHERKILHRDLKTKNIFLTEDLTVKVGDLGIAKQLDFTLAEAETFLGTPLYMSPEIFQFQPYSYKADIWSFGCCIYEMMTLRFAFESPSQHQMVQRILKGKVPNAPSTYSEELADLARTMLCKDPKGRPHAADIVNELQPDAKAVRPVSGDIKMSPRSRRRQMASQRSNSSVEMPDLLSSLRADRHDIVDSLMKFFQNNTHTGMGNGFEIGVINSAKSGISRTVKTIMTRCPSQEETTLLTREFGTNLQKDNDVVDNVSCRETGKQDTVKKSPQKSKPSKQNDASENSDIENMCFHDNPTDPDEVIRWAKKNLVSCQTSPVTKEQHQEQPKSKGEDDDVMGKTKKKKNFLKTVSERRKSSSSSSASSTLEKKPPKQPLSATNGSGKPPRPTSGGKSGSKTVTLFTRSQQVVFQRSDSNTDDLSPDAPDTDIQSQCERELGEDMMTHARQLVKLVKDKKLLQAQLEDLIGWRNYQKFGDYLCGLRK